MSRELKKVCLADTINDLIIKEIGVYTTEDLEDIIVCMINNHIYTSDDSIKNLIASLERLMNVT